MGAGVGRGVGRTVGRTVGRAVAMAVGDGVPRDGGVGVGTTATIGPSDATGEVDGATDGAIDGCTEGSTGGCAEGSTDGSTEGPTGEVGTGVTVGAGDATGDGPTADGDGLAVPGTAATSDSGRLGPTKPAVSATVARMRFRSPMATTRRAR